MTTNKKAPVPYAGRLVRESAKLGLRVAGVFGGVVAGALWEGARQLPQAVVQRGVGSTGIEPIGSYGEAQEAFAAGRIQAADMSYYRAVYNADDA